MVCLSASMGSTAFQNSSKNEDSWTKVRWHVCKCIWLRGLLLPRPCVWIAYYEVRASSSHVPPVRWTSQHIWRLASIKTVCSWRLPSKTTLYLLDLLAVKKEREEKNLSVFHACFFFFWGGGVWFYWFVRMWSGDSVRSWASLVALRLLNF